MGKIWEFIMWFYDIMTNDMVYHTPCRIKTTTCYKCNGDQMVYETLGYWEECEFCSGKGAYTTGYCYETNNRKLISEFGQDIVISGLEIELKHLNKQY